MKHGKKPTRRQRVLMEKRRLNPRNWLVIECTKDHMKVIHRHTDHVRIIPEGIA